MVRLERKEIEEKAPEIFEALKNLYLDLVDVDDDRDPETGEEFSACRAARKVLESIHSGWDQAEVLEQ